MELANKTYDILVKHAGATESLRDVFLHRWPPDEYRFCGHLGLGGKFHYKTFKVSCYPEDETPGRKELINITNEELSKLKE